ncbi:MAG: hypothetical protein CMI67_24500 [Pelagibaca sp.]|nr:hypothetical protein [Pelagibaca sp.]
MEVSDDTLELIERRMSERVESRVRKDLFKYYRAIWGIALVVLGFFGYKVFSGIEEMAKGYAETSVKVTLEENLEAAKKATDAALETANKITAQVEALEEFQKSRWRVILAAEGQAKRDEARVEHLKAATEEQLRDMTGQLEDAEAQLDAISERARNTTGQGGIDALAQNVLSLGEQVEIITKAVQALESREGLGAEPVVTEENQARLAEVVADARTQAAEAEQPSETVVYFQFAGVKREVAVAISRELELDGYKMPGEERTAKAAGKHQVRYFFEADKERAKQLVEDVNRALSGQGYRGDVATEDFTGYTSTKPRQGTLELWLEPIPGV